MEILKYHLIMGLKNDNFYLMIKKHECMYFFFPGSETFWGQNIVITSYN